MSANLGPAGRIVRAFIESKLTPLLVIAAIALGGFAVMNTPREEEPQIVVPMVDVFVELPGAGAEEVENRVTVPLEKRMWEIPGVEYVYSVSMPGRTMVIVRFVVGEDEERSLVKVFEKLASGMDVVPPGASAPLVKARSIDDVPVLALTFWSETRSDFELRSIAAEVKRELGRIDGLSETTLIGGRRRTLTVYLDPSRMEAFGVDLGSVRHALTAQNTSLRAGSFDQMDRQVIVEMNAILESADDVGDLVVGVYGDRPVHLRDVADVHDGAEEVERVVLHMRDGDELQSADGREGEVYPALTLAVSKRKGVDAARIVEDALEKVDDLRGRLIPSDVNVDVSRNYGETASEKAGELLKHLFGAIVSVTVVIALFLGWRGGLVVFISVPVTFALTLFVYYIFGYTLNRVTLFALIFVTGIVVDDSIIVVENIVRHLSFTKKKTLEAAIDAVNEVGNPTILATLTVIAAVVPMAFVRGLMGPYMRPMPVGATLAMTFSLLVALIAAPWFAYRLLRGPADRKALDRSNAGDEDNAGIKRTLTYRVYRSIVLPMLERPILRWGFLLFVFLLLAGSVALFPLKLVTVKMLPFDNKSEMQVVIDMPEGTTLEATRRVATDIARALHAVPEVADTQIYVGTASPVNFNGLVRHYDLRRSANMADIQVNLAPKHERERKSHDIAKSIRPIAEKIARRHQASIKIAEVPPGPPVASTLVAEIYGPTEKDRLELAERVKRIFEETEGVVDVDWYVETPQVEQHFVVDREKAGLHGVDARQIADSLYAALEGASAGLLHVPDAAEDVPIEVRLPRELRSSVDALGTIPVRTHRGGTLDLAELSRVEEKASTPYRYRKNLRPVVYVTGDVAGVAESPVYAILDMAQKIEALEAASGARIEQYYRDEPWSDEEVSVKWDGEWQITYEVFRDLGAAFAVVMVLIYILIIGWFRSFKVPLVMMISIPLSLVGILPAHALMGFFFTATSMIGFIALAGIMVRNAVLLIDFIDLAVGRGQGLIDAVIEGGAVRFRPILLTAGTVIVGAVVILFDPIFEGLAISLMAGSFASTVLTLVVVPVVYYMIQKGGKSR